MIRYIDAYYGRFCGLDDDGAPMTVGDMIRDMQEKGTPQAAVNAWLTGFDQTHPLPGESPDLPQALP